MFEYIIQLFEAQEQAFPGLEACPTNFCRSISTIAFGQAASRLFVVSHRLELSIAIIHFLCLRAGREVVWLGSSERNGTAQFACCEGEASRAKERDTRRAPATCRHHVSNHVVDEGLGILVVFYRV